MMVYGRGLMRAKCQFKVQSTLAGRQGSGLTQQAGREGGHPS
jgi:hypothetical protein